MALSHRTTTLAVLRGILGPKHGQQARFARLAGRSVSWVKKVSAGLEPLTEELALVLEAGIGISAAWLLKADPSAPAVDSAGKPYDFPAFERHRAHLKSGPIPKPPLETQADTVSIIAGIAAAARKKGNASLFNYRLAQFLDECRADFGFAASAAIPKPTPHPKPTAQPRNTQKLAKLTPSAEPPDLAVHLL